MAWTFGILGAIASMVYYIRFDPSRHPVHAWSIANVGVLVIYVAVGFVVGWILGIAISKIGDRDL